MELSPPVAGSTTWTETVLHSFEAEGTAPYVPVGGVVADAAGNLYGATHSGGAQGVGAIYELMRPNPGGSYWSLRVRHSFTGSDGQTPVGSLLIDNLGNLYVATSGGGASGYGVVFELSPPPRSGHAWKSTVLFSYDNGAGGGPAPRFIMDDKGRIDGTSVNGGEYSSGTVFRLTPPLEGGSGWTETVLKSFDATHGKYPMAGLGVDGAGNLYGTTIYGGRAGVGIVFKMEP